MSANDLSSSLFSSSSLFITLHAAPALNDLLGYSISTCYSSSSSSYSLSSSNPLLHQGTNELLVLALSLLLLNLLLLEPNLLIISVLAWSSRYSFKRSELVLTTIGYLKWARYWLNSSLCLYTGLPRITLEESTMTDSALNAKILAMETIFSIFNNLISNQTYRDKYKNWLNKF